MMGTSVLSSFSTRYLLLASSGVSELVLMSNSSSKEYRLILAKDKSTRNELSSVAIQMKLS